MRRAVPPRTSAVNARLPSATAAIGFGIGAVVLRVIDELALQSGSLHDGLALAGLSFAIGILLATRRPRFIARCCRIGGVLNGHLEAARGRITASPALLAATLALVQAATCGAALATVAGAEAWRERVVVATILPEPVTVAAVCAPVCAALAACGAAAAASLAAMLHWESSMEPRPARLPSAVRMFACSVFVGVVVVLALGSLRLVAFAALFSPLVAALFAASERAVSASSSAASGLLRPGARRVAVAATFAALSMAVVVMLLPRGRLLSEAEPLGALSSGLEVASSTLTPIHRTSSRPSIWRIDLAGPRFDAIRIATLSEGAAPTTVGRQERRGLRRGIRALMPNGRLVFDVNATVLAWHAATATGRPLFKVTLAAADGTRVELLAVGRDVREWVALRCAGSAWSAVVEPLTLNEGQPRL